MMSSSMLWMLLSCFGCHTFTSLDMRVSPLDWQTGVVLPFFKTWEWRIPLETVQESDSFCQQYIRPLQSDSINAAHCYQSVHNLDRISQCRQGAERVWVVGLRIWFLLFPSNAVLKSTIQLIRLLQCCGCCASLL